MLHGECWARAHGEGPRGIARSSQRHALSHSAWRESNPNQGAGFGFSYLRVSLISRTPTRGGLRVLFPACVPAEIRTPTRTILFASALVLLANSRPGALYCALPLPGTRSRRVRTAVPCDDATYDDRAPKEALDAQRLRASTDLAFSGNCWTQNAETVGKGRSLCQD